MVINGKDLFERSPIVNMVGEKIHSHGVSYGLGEAGYDIRLKQTVTIGEDRWGNQRVCIQEPGGESIMSGGRFLLASTMEEFSMPNNLVGVVHDKSTWARQGLSVFNTVIEPGWSGFLTLELVYHAGNTLTIPAGAGIAQVLFHEISTPAAYCGKYQNQANEPVSSKFK